MAEVDNFTWIVSSRSTPEFPNNEPNHFTQALHQTQRFDEPWSVGIQTASFPQHFAPIGPNNSNIVLIKKIDNDDDVSEFITDDGTAESIIHDGTEAIKIIHDVEVLPQQNFEGANYWTGCKWYKQHKSSHEFLRITMVTTGKLAGRLMIQPFRDNEIIVLSGKICHALGFAQTRVSFDHKGPYTESDGVIGIAEGEHKSFSGSDRWYVADFPFEVPRIRHIYVYTDIIQPVRVGDQLHQLLLHADAAEAIEFQPHKIIYHPLSVSQLSRVNFWMADGTGHPVYFFHQQESQFFITLHFRKDKPRIL